MHFSLAVPIKWIKHDLPRQWQLSGNLTRILETLKASKSQLEGQVVEESANLRQLKKQLLESQQKRLEFINQLEEAVQGQALNLATSGDRLQELQNIKREEGLLEAQMESLAALDAETAQESQSLRRMLLGSSTATSFVQDRQKTPELSKISAHLAF